MFGLANVRVCLIQLDFSVNRLYYNRNLELINVVQNFYGRFQHESCSRGISQVKKKGAFNFYNSGYGQIEIETNL